MVMRQGRVIEEGRTRDVLTSPREDYTKALIGAVLPVPEREDEL